MTDPNHIVRKLTDDFKMKEAEIVDALKLMGVDVTQASINRIKQNKQRPGYDIGRALERLYEARAS